MEMQHTEKLYTNVRNLTANLSGTHAVPIERYGRKSTTYNLTWPDASVKLCTLAARASNRNKIVL